MHDDFFQFLWRRPFLEHGVSQLPAAHILALCICKFDSQLAADFSRRKFADQEDQATAMTLRRTVRTVQAS